MKVINLFSDRFKFQKFIDRYIKNPNDLILHEESIVNVYLTNVEQMIVSCKLRNIPVLYVLQPSLDMLFRLYSKYVDKEVKSEIKEKIKPINKKSRKLSLNFFIRYCYYEKKDYKSFQFIDLK